MNPLTNVKNLQKINERELKMGLVGHDKSWHSKYKNSAWIYFGGVSFDLTEGDLICIFSQYGEIVNINLVRDKNTGKSRGFGFLCYEDQRSTTLAIDNLNGAKVVNRTIRVDHVENYKPPKDSEEYDQLTKLLHEKGCAPEVVAAQNQPQDGGGSPSDQSNDEGEVEKAKRKQLKKEKKRAKKAKKKLKKEQKKKLKALKKQSRQADRSDSSSSSASRSRSSSPSSSEDVKPAVKIEPLDDVCAEVRDDRSRTSNLTIRDSKDIGIEGVNFDNDRKPYIKREPSEASTRTRGPDRRTSPLNARHSSTRRSRSPARRHRSRSPVQRAPQRSPTRRQPTHRDSRSRSPDHRHRKTYRRSESPRDRYRSSRDDNRSRHRSPDARRR